MNRFFRAGTYLFYLQRTVKSYNVREKVARFIARRIGKKSLNPRKFLGFEYAPSYAESLHRDGFVELPVRLSNEVIESLIQASSLLPLTDNFHPEVGTFHLGTVAPQTHVADFKREDLLRLPNVLDIANDSEVLKVVQDFLGATPTISNVNMWWSFAGHKKAEDAQLFHRDVDDIKFCKLFIYLTDVGPKDGPHTYVKGSSSTNKLTKIRRYQDQEIKDVFGEENIIHFIRPKGSMFLVDTYGFHKGTLPIDHNRLLLQVQYSLLPIWIEEYQPVNITDVDHDSYVNRLLIQNG